MNLKAERAAALKAANDIADAAKAANRDLTDREVAQIEAHLENVKKLDERIEKAARGTAILEYIASGPAPLEHWDGAPYVEGEKAGVSLFQLKNAGGMVARHLMTADGPRGVKAVPTTIGQSVPTVVDPEPIGQGGRVDSIFDLLPVVPVETPAWTYRRGTVRELNAAVVGTGEVKPGSRIEFEDVTNTLAVIAHVAGPLPESTLIDYPAMVRFVQDEMLLGVRLAVEDEVFAGSGEVITSADGRTVGAHLRGILNTTGVLHQDPAGDALATIATATTRLEADGYTVAGIAMHPDDFVTIATKRNTSGGFDLGGAVDPAARTIWGVPVRFTRGLTKGTALALSAGAAAIRTGREGLDVRAVQINDDAARNQIRVRVEGRFALDMYRPGGIVAINLAAA